MVNACQICGVPLPDAAKRQRYCPACAKKSRRESIARYHRGIREENKSSEAAIKPRKPTKLSSDPLSGMSAMEVELEARKHGMNYGTYSAAISAGTMKRIVGINKI